MPIMTIDPGHGGNDSGACGNGYKEKDLTLDFSLKLRDHLTRSSWTVKMTRTTDVNVANSTRTGMMKGSHFGISVHLNAGGGNGVEVIVPSREPFCGTTYVAIYSRWKHGGAIRPTYAYSRDYHTGKKYARQYNQPVNTSSSKFTSVYNFTDYYFMNRDPWALGTSCEIIEYAFIDNKADVQNFIDNMDNIVYTYAKEICKAFGVKFVEPPKPTPPPVPKPDPVKVGDKIYIQSGAVYRGSANGKPVPKEKIKPNGPYTVSKIQDVTGGRAALIKEINSWVQIDKLEIYVKPPEETVSKAEYDKVVAQKAELTKEVGELNEKISTLQSTLTGKDKTIADKMSEIEELKKQVAAKNAEIARLNDLIAANKKQYDSTIAQKDAEIEKLQDELANAVADETRKVAINNYVASLDALVKLGGNK